MTVYDIYLIDDEKYLVGTIFDEDFVKFIVEIASKTYDFNFEYRSRELTTQEK